MSDETIRCAGCRINGEPHSVHCERDPVGEALLSEMHRLTDTPRVEVPSDDDRRDLLAHHEAEARRLRFLLGEPGEADREPSAIEMSGVRVEYADGDLAEAIRFHGIMTLFAAQRGRVTAEGLPALVAAAKKMSRAEKRTSDD